MSRTPVRIVHVIPQLSLGGAGRALISLVKYSSRFEAFEHEILSLQKPDAMAVELALSSDARTLTPVKNGTLETLNAADIVQFHFWNTPEIHLLLNANLPKMRSVVWLHVNGAYPPQSITANVCNVGDIVVASDSKSMHIPALSKIATKLKVIIPGTDPERLDGHKPVDHATFNVGYIGTLSFSKMHPDFVAMHAVLDIPDIRIIVYGEGQAADTLKRQAKQLSVDDRFEFRGYAENIRDALGALDVFGYPLCVGNYSTGELALQEAMLAGVPPVVLPFGGAANRIIHGETGLIAQDTGGYSEAIRFLYKNPAIRARLGTNATDHARREFSAETTALKFNEIYCGLMEGPKSSHLSPAKSTLQFTARDGASLFILSLGETDIDFRASLNRDGGKAAVAAEKLISDAASSLFETLLQYRSYFPDDPSLRFWSGLLLQALGRPALAASEFNRSVSLGCDHWRIYWHLAKAAGAAGSAELAARAAAQAKVSALREGITLD
ncbi:hypothetical protein BH10PSE11_BH10PSE11_06110 [soil metagenome]